jgi:ribose transport system permease protein
MATPVAPRPASWRRHLQTAGPLLGLIFVLGLLALSEEARPTLFTGRNAAIILTQTVIVALGAVGMTMIIVSGGIDLSVGAAVAFSSVVGAKLLTAGHNSWVAAAAVVGTGALIGAANGGLIAGLRLSPFIITLGMMGVVRGGAKWISGKQAVYNPDGSGLNALMERTNPQGFLPLPPASGSPRAWPWSPASSCGAACSDVMCMPSARANRPRGCAASGFNGPSSGCTRWPERSSAWRD